MKRPMPDKPLMDERLAEVILEAQAPILPPPERARVLRERVLARAREEPCPIGANEHLTILSGEGRWFQLGPGIAMKPMREDETTRSYLLRMAPGTRLPPHDHSQEEECMVVEGDVWLGEVHAHAGDYHLARRGLPHGEVRTETGCLLFLRGQKHYEGMFSG